MESKMEPINLVNIKMELLESENNSDDVGGLHIFGNTSTINIV